MYAAPTTEWAFAFQRLYAAHTLNAIDHLPTAACSTYLKGVGSLKT